MLLSGSNDRTFLNYREAKKALWLDAIKPSLDAYLDKLSRWMAPKFKEDGQYLQADYSEIDVLQTDTASMVAWMIMSKSFTKNEIREAAGFETLPDPAMDLIYENAGMVPLSELGMMPEQQLTEEVMKVLKVNDYRNAKVKN
jgi:phage portal protein BeeE